MADIPILTYSPYTINQNTWEMHSTPTSDYLIIDTMMQALNLLEEVPVSRKGVRINCVMTPASPYSNMITLCISNYRAVSDLHKAVWHCFARIIELPLSAPDLMQRLFTWIYFFKTYLTTIQGCSISLLGIFSCQLSIKTLSLFLLTSGSPMNGANSPSVVSFIRLNFGAGVN
jgi:hypothetical protein